MVLDNLIKKYQELSENKADIQKAFEIIRDVYKCGGKLLVCGNGGSSSDSDHIVGELMKGFILKRPIPNQMREKLLEVSQEEGNYLADNLQGALPAISLSSNSTLMTAFANDVAPDMVFAQQVYGYSVKGDVLVGISTSGNSKNVIRALKVAKAMGVNTIGLTGAGGGLMKEICDATICVPYKETYEIQERHLPIYHALCIMIEEEFFQK